MSQFAGSERQKIVTAAALAWQLLSSQLSCWGADSGFPQSNNVKLEVVSSEPFNSLTDRFRPLLSTGEHWLGADAAYSIPLSSSRTLWMFGDTFIRTTGGKQIMINNSAAMQETKSETPLTYYWKRFGSGDKSLLSPLSTHRWFWPLDGFVHQGKLFEVMNEIEHSPNRDAVFSFQSVGQRLLRVSNPQAPPNAWRLSLEPLKKRGVQFGNAVFAERNYAYIFCSYMPAQKGIYKHPLIVARIANEKLETGNVSSEFEFWCHAKNSGGKWLKSLANPIVLFQDGAPEMSVGSIRGLKGLFAVYLPAGFSNEVMLRHAERPEGPWSTPIPVYKCPVDSKQFFVYSAKAHPELASQNGELIITYCVNHMRPERNSTLGAGPQSYYYPHAVRIMLTVPNAGSSY